MTNERKGRRALIITALAGLGVGLAAAFAGRGGLARWIWAAGTIPVATSLVLSIIRDLRVAADPETPPLFVIAADLPLTHIDAILSEKDIGEVKLGDKASFSVASFPNRPFAGEVTQIPQSPQTYQHVATYDVVISAPNPDLSLEPGMAATIRIVIDRHRAAGHPSQFLVGTVVKTELDADEPCRRFHATID